MCDNKRLVLSIFWIVLGVVLVNYHPRWIGNGILLIRQVSTFRK